MFSYGKKKNVAQVIVDVLASVGVRRVMLSPAIRSNRLTDAIFSHEDVWMDTRAPRGKWGAFAGRRGSAPHGKLCCALLLGPVTLYSIQRFI